MEKSKKLNSGENSTVRTTTHFRWDANNIQRISFGFLNQFVFFSCEWSDVAVSNHYRISQDGNSSMTFKSHRVSLPCALSSPEMRSEALWLKLVWDWNFKFLIGMNVSNYEVEVKKTHLFLLSISGNLLFVLMFRINYMWKAFPLVGFFLPCCIKCWWKYTRSVVPKF